MPLKICFRLTIFAIRLPPPMGPDNEPPPPCPLLPPPPPEPLRREPPPSKGWSKVAINLVPSIHTGSSRITVSRQSYAIPLRDWPPHLYSPACIHQLPCHNTIPLVPWACPAFSAARVKLARLHQEVPLQSYLVQCMYIHPALVSSSAT